MASSPRNCITTNWCKPNKFFQTAFILTRIKTIRCFEQINIGRIQLFQKPMPDFYYTIEKETTAEYKDRGSRFLAYAFPISTVDDFKTRLKALKGDHPKAAHHCFAYRL